MRIYLIKRGPRPEYHRAPFHPVIICTVKRIAKQEAGDSGAQANVWEQGCEGQGFLYVRWNGFDIDYGHVVHRIHLPDGSTAGFRHDLHLEPWTLLKGAIWWSTRPIPLYLSTAGVIYPPDEFSRQSILDQAANDGCSGFGREPMPFWPPASIP